MTTTDLENKDDKSKDNNSEEIKKKKISKKAIKDKKSSKDKVLLEKQIEETNKLEELIEHYKQEIESKDKLVQQYKDDALRYMADLENFKKRKNNEVDSFKKFAKEDAIKEFLPILDNFTIACEHAHKEDQNQQETIKGFVLISKQIESVLEKLDVKVINSLNEKFDPNFHQAIGQEKNDNVESSIVIKEVQKGFLLFDKVIRPSMVIVSE